MNKIKVFGIVIILLFVIGALTRLFKDDAPSQKSETDTLTSSLSNQDREKIKQKIIDTLKYEPKIKEAIITDANIIYISVLDDGSIRDGLAQYYCEQIKPFGLNLKVKIVKFGSTKDPNRDNAYGVLLGQNECL